MSATYTTNPSSPNTSSSFTLTWLSSVPLTGGRYILNLQGLNGNYISESANVSSGVTQIVYSFQSGMPPDTYTVFVTGPDGYNVSANPLTITCFVEGSEILCIVDGEEKYVKVEDLSLGDLVKTYNNEPKKIEHIMKHSFVNDKSKSQICKISGRPNQTKDLFLTGGHSLLVDELTEEQEKETVAIWKGLKKIDDKFLLLCFVDNSNEKVEDEQSYNLYHFVLENEDAKGQYGVYANGILTESISKHEYLKSNNTLKV